MQCIQLWSICNVCNFNLEYSWRNEASHTTTCLEKILIAEHVVEPAVLGHVLSVRKYNEALHSWQLALQLNHQIHKNRVQHDELVFCMVDDVFQLFLEEPATTTVRYCYGIIPGTCESQRLQPACIQTSLLWACHFSPAPDWGRSCIDACSLQCHAREVTCRMHSLPYGLVCGRLCFDLQNETKHVQQHTHDVWLTHVVSNPCKHNRSGVCRVWQIVFRPPKQNEACAPTYI